MTSSSIRLMLNSKLVLATLFPIYSLVNLLSHFQYLFTYDLRFVFLKPHLFYSSQWEYFMISKQNPNASINTDRDSCLLKYPLFEQPQNNNASISDRKRLKF